MMRLVRNALWVAVLALSGDAAAGAPPLRAIAAFGDSAVGTSTTFNTFLDAEMSAGGIVLLRADTGLWRIVDGEIALVMAADMDRPGGGTYRTPIQAAFAGDDIVFVEGPTWQESLFVAPEGADATRLIGVGDSVDGVPVTVIAIDDTNALGHIVLMDGQRAIALDTAGSVITTLTRGQEIPEHPGLTPEVYANTRILDDKGEFSVMVLDDDPYNRDRAVLHGPPGTWGIIDLTTLIPNPYTDVAFGQVYCCDLDTAGTNGFHVVSGRDVSTTDGTTTTVFRGLPAVLTESFQIPPGGIVPGGGSGAKLMDWTGPTSTVIGPGGDFAARVELQPTTGGPIDAIVLGTSGLVRQLVEDGEVIDGFAVFPGGSGTAVDVCAVTDDYVVFNAGQGSEGAGVVAYDRQTNTREVWWAPGMRFPHPTLGEVVASDVTCYGPSRLWEQNQALVFVRYETAPGNGQYQWLLLDGGVFVPTDVGPDGVVVATVGTSILTVETFNAGDQTATTPILTVEVDKPMIVVDAACKLTRADSATSPLKTESPTVWVATCLLDDLEPDAGSTVQLILVQGIDDVHGVATLRIGSEDANPFDNVAFFENPGAPDAIDDESPGCAAAPGGGWLATLLAGLAVAARRRSRVDRDLDGSSA